MDCLKSKTVNNLAAAFLASGCLGVVLVTFCSWIGNAHVANHLEADHLVMASKVTFVRNSAQES